MKDGKFIVLFLVPLFFSIYGEYTITRSGRKMYFNSCSCGRSSYDENYRYKRRVKRETSKESIDVEDKENVKLSFKIGMNLSSFLDSENLVKKEAEKRKLDREKRSAEYYDDFNSYDEQNEGRKPSTLRKGKRKSRRMLVEDKLDMYLDMEDMDDSDYAIKENEPLVEQRLRSEKREPRVENSSRKNKRKQFTAKRLGNDPTEEDKLRHSQLIDEELDMYIDMKNMEEMDEMDALNSEESRKKPRKMRFRTAKRNDRGKNRDSSSDESEEIVRCTGKSDTTKKREMLLIK